MDNNNQPFSLANQLKGVAFDVMGLLVLAGVVAILLAALNAQDPNGTAERGLAETNAVFDQLISQVVSGTQAIAEVAPVTTTVRSTNTVDGVIGIMAEQLTAAQAELIALKAGAGVTNTSTVTQ